MGKNVFNDINSFNEITPDANGKKVVIIYTTAGNLHDDDDTKTCNCRDPLDPKGGPFPYWKVREQGAKNSLHLAACRMGGWGPAIPYPKNKTALINGHLITRYEYKNTVSYFLRMKAGIYSHWFNDPNVQVSTVDSSTTYADYTDFVNTLYHIYHAEMDSNLSNHNLHIHCPDIDETINPNDHHDHLIAGRGACEAAKILSTELDTCFSHSLYVDYHSQNLPANLTSPDIQNEAALTSAYCMALLDYNAWPEWGNIYQDWTARNYFRTITTCQSPISENIMAKDSLETLIVKVFPNPADSKLFVRFNLPVKTAIDISVFDVNGTSVFRYNGPLTENMFQINTAFWSAGYYLITVNTNNKPLVKTIFEVIHH
jgi:hypothetical protein